MASPTGMGDIVPVEARDDYLPAEENLVTLLVPSEMACLLNSPGRINLTAVWISREEMVDRLL